MLNWFMFHELGMYIMLHSSMECANFLCDYHFLVDRFDYSRTRSEDAVSSCEYPLDH